MLYSKIVVSIEDCDVIDHTKSDARAPAKKPRQARKLLESAHDQENMPHAPLATPLNPSETVDLHDDVIKISSSAGVNKISCKAPTTADNDDKKRKGGDSEGGPSKKSKQKTEGCAKEVSKKAEGRAKGVGKKKAKPPIPLPKGQKTLKTFLRL